MVAYNFQARFVDQIVSGEKRQTIRPIGKRRHAEPGDRLQLYTGMRTKACRKLVEPDPVCVEASVIVLHETEVFMPEHMLETTVSALNGIARADGFKHWQEMCDWFADTHGLPFEGVLIKWEPEEEQKP